MGNKCEDKITFACAPGQFARCVKTEVVPPSFSSLTTTCNTVQDVEVDVYGILAAIKLETDLTAITATCGTLPTIKNIKTLIQYLVNRDCTQQALIDALTVRVTTLETQMAVQQARICP
jgi:hypothetical protein